MALPADFWIYAVISLIVGAMAGGADVLSRYRDEPFRAAISGYGIGYMALNGAAAVLALALFGIEETGSETAPFKGAIVADNLVLNAIAVGTGAMLFLRSKLFTIRSENGNQTAFGPQIILDALLVVLDRGIDRQRAAARHKLVNDHLAGVSKFADTVAFFQMSLLSFQNLTENEKAQLVAIIDEYDKDTAWSDQLKVMAVGFAILTIAGEGNFTDFVTRLKTHLGDET